MPECRLSTEIIGETLYIDASIEANKRVWGNPDNWPDGGESWSDQWGGTENLYNDVIWPRIKQYMPRAFGLEIAPGYGRITEYLLVDIDHYVGVDINENCVSACQERFALWDTEFVLGDGYTLDNFPALYFDFIFSWDSLVHCSQAVLESYIWDMKRVMAPGAVAFLHHSNFKDSRAQSNPHWRDESCSAEEIADYAKWVGFEVSQELIEWGNGEYLTDCLTTLTTNGKMRSD